MQMPNDDFSVEELVCNDSFQQYCQGSDLENCKLWEEWICERPGNALEIEEAREIVCILTAKQGSRIEQRQELISGINQSEAFTELIAGGTGTILKHSSIQNRRFYKYIGGVAAAMIIISSIWIIQKQSSSLGLIATNAPEKIINSGSAIRKTVILSDGTLITMGRESSIRFRQNFSNGKRELWLSGEAFFDVKHDRAHPFTVHTNSNNIHVLGTVFNVKAYPGAVSTETTLIHGSVRVNAKKYSDFAVILKPNEKLISYNRSSDNQNIDRSSYSILPVKSSTAGTGKPDEIKWVRNRLDIEDEPLAVIAKKLQHWYGITIIVTDDEVKNYHYSGVFENENVIKTLEALQLSYPFKFTVEQDRITISKSK